MASDAVFNCSRVIVKAFKHILLGLTKSSLTGSKTLMQMLNKLCHSICYSNAKELENNFAKSNRNSSSYVPDGIALQTNSSLGLAFDNYDATLDTLGGKTPYT